MDKSIDRLWPAVAAYATALMPTLWILAVIGATISPTLRHENSFEIFRDAWINLANGRDLYAAHAEHFDLFKYTPTFALLFAPFGVLPFALALLLWNGVNAATLYLALGQLLPLPRATIVRAIVFVDMVGSLQNAQSNALVAGLMVLTFTELAHRRYLRAATAASLGTFINIFPLVATSFTLLEGNRRRFATSCIVVGTALLFCPLLLNGPRWLIHQYSDWFVVQRVDAGDPGFSVMQLTRLWLGVDWPAWPQQLAGTAILIAPIALCRKLDCQPWRLRYVASLLIFCVLFNHQSENPSFVIAMAGVGVWFALARRTWASWLVLAFVFVGGILTSSSLAPHALRAELFALRFKTVPILLVWVILQCELWCGASRNKATPQPSH
jgi:hypothetical protein